MFSIFRTLYIDEQYLIKNYDFCYDIDRFYSSYTWWEICLWLGLFIWMVIVAMFPLNSIRLGPVIQKLTDMTPNPKQLNSLQGLRVMSLFWVITGHVFLYYGISTGTKSYTYFTEEYARDHPIRVMFLQNATLSVDAFFVISGFLSGYILAKKYGSGANQTGFNFTSLIFAILKRMARFIPPTGAAIALTMAFLSKPNSQTDTIRGYFAWPGPSRVTGLDVGGGGSEELAAGCQKKWYMTLFLIFFTDQYSSESTCLGHLWYLSTDFWCGIFVLVVLYFYFASADKPDLQNFGFYLGLGLWLFTVTFNLVRAFLLQDEFGFSPVYRHEKYPSNITAGYWSENYACPWYRVGPYLIACYAGILLVKYQKTNKTEKYSSNRFKIVLGLVGVIACIYYNLPNLYTVFYPRWMAITLTALWRNIFGLAFSYLIYQLEKSKQGWLYQICSSPKWYFLSRINFSAYICHWFAQTLVVQRFMYEFTFWTEAYLWAFTTAMIVHSYCFALFFHLFFENPLNVLFDNLLNKIIMRVK